jgi:hypothetical protein
MSIACGRFFESMLARAAAAVRPGPCCCWCCCWSGPGAGAAAAAAAAAACCRCRWLPLLPLAAALLVVAPRWFAAAGGGVAQTMLPASAAPRSPAPRTARQHRALAMQGQRNLIRPRTPPQARRRVVPGPCAASSGFGPGASASRQHPPSQAQRRTLGAPTREQEVWQHGR